MSFYNTVQVTNELNGIEKQTSNVIISRMTVEAKLDKLNQDIHDERTQYILLQNEIEQALLLKQEVKHCCIRMRNTDETTNHLSHHLSLLFFISSVNCISLNFRTWN